MPNTASAKKALRQNTKRRAQNRSQRSTLRTLLKKTRESAEGTAPPTAEGKATAEGLLRESSKKLDQAASRRLIHPNKASRLKSRLAKLFKKSQSAVAPASGAGQ